MSARHRNDQTAPPDEGSRPATWSAIVTRTTGLGLIWLALAGSDAADLVAGIPAVAAGLWTSLHLLPPSQSRLSLAGFAGFAIDFLRSSLLAGIDVASRAFSPTLPLKPGYVVCPCTLGGGIGRDVFRAIMSLQPGTLPVRDLGQKGIVLHCLDTSAPIASDFAKSEARFRHLLTAARQHG